MGAPADVEETPRGVPPHPLPQIISTYLYQPPTSAPTGMHMGLMSKFLGHESAPKRHGSLGEANYLDLGEMEIAAGGDAQVSTWIKVCELVKLDDFKEFAHHVYDGHRAVVDIRNSATDEIHPRRFTAEARKVANDVRGDVAGIGDGLVAVTPGGVAVDKHKVRVVPRN